MLETKVIYLVKCNFCGKYLTKNNGNKHFKSLNEIMRYGQDKGWNFTWDYEKVSCPECDGIKKVW